MHQNCMTQYKISRESAGLTQEQAVEALEMYFLSKSKGSDEPHTISVRTLSDYENGHAKVSNKMVRAMAEIYGCMSLIYVHVSNDPYIGDQYPDKANPKTGADAAVLAFDVADTFSPMVDTLMRMARKPPDNETLLHLADTIKSIVRGSVVGLEAYLREVVEGKAKW